jgi:predicted transcriptional regulator YdeE
MKLMQFMYTKTNGDKSDRAIVVTQEPTHLIAGFDVSELPEIEFEVFTREMRELKNRQHEEMLELVAKHDLKHNYRQFTPSKMTNVTTELI